jgi:DNA polymerase III epsilon subunit-like protein
MDNLNYLHGLHYFNLGLNATCISNIVTEHNFYNKNIFKVPCHKWKDLRDRRQTIEELKAYPWDKSTGVGVVAGFNNLHLMDIDGCISQNFLFNILKYLGLPNDYEWVVQSGSLNGYHIYFFSNRFENLKSDDVVSTFPANSKHEYLFDKIEILWKTHAVLPPSLHNSSHEYSFLNCRIPSEKPKWIDINKFSTIENLYLYKSKEVVKTSYFEEWVATEKINQPSNQDEIQLSKLKGNLYLIFDTETDGLIDKSVFGTIKYPSIVQISWLIMDEDGIVYKKVADLVKSDFDKYSDAFKINNINPDRILQLGKDPKIIYKEFLNDIKYCKFIVAHNIDFDLPILKNEMKKAYLETEQLNKQQICTMKEGSKLFISQFDNNPKYPKLSELFEKLFNYKVTQIHNAQSDVLLASKCLRELIKKEVIK